MSEQHVHLTSTAPVVITFLQWLIDPAITVLTLLALMDYYHQPVDGLHLALLIIAFLLAANIFRDADLTGAWSKGGLRAQTMDLLVSWVELVVVLAFLGYASGYLWFYSQELLMAWAIITPPVILAGHGITRWLLLLILKSPENARDAVIVGVNDLSRRLAERILKDRQLGIVLKGWFDDRNAERVGTLPGGKYLGQFQELPDYVRRNRIRVIYIALPILQQERIVNLLQELRDTTASIYFVPDIFVFDLIQSRLDHIDGIPLVALCETPFYGVNNLVKRLSDIVIASVALVVLSPVMLAVAIAVKVTSPGPVIFKQRRYGLDGREIEVYKFRSMTVCEDGGVIRQATKNDKRVTPIGRFLRRTSLDELPQFINVLQGRMSVVGPRPHAVAHNEQYRGLIKGYMVRHKVKPGITGWAQVNGFRGETQSLERMASRIQYDLDYLRNWSLALDLKIILKTVLVIFRDRNAY